MPGSFSKDARPLRTGGYTNFEAPTAAAIPPSVGSVVMVPITHDWGPFKVPTLCLSNATFLQKFRDGATTGKRDVRFAFQGEDFDGRNGAGAVIVYRTGTAAAAKATKVIQNSTPANALTVTALYEGTKGNTIATQDVTKADGTRDFVVTVNTVEVERYNHVATDLTTLAAAINAQSNWLRASVTLDGVALVTTLQTLAGGNNGEVLTGTEWTALMAALEFERFGIFTTSQVDATILAALKTWVQGRNKSGQRFLAVVGGNGATGTGPDSMSAANTRSTTLNDQNFINVGGFAVIDEVEGALNPGQAAPRIAGVFAARGRNRSMSLARLRGWTLSAAPSSAEVDSAYAAGTVTLARDSDPVAPVYIEKGLTTFTTQNDVTRPYRIYRNPKFVLTMAIFETELAEYAVSPGLIGELGVNDATRSAIVGDAVARLKAMEASNIIQAGWNVGVDGDPPPSNDDEYVALKYRFKFTRTVEQVYNTVVVG